MNPPTEGKIVAIADASVYTRVGFAITSSFFAA